MSTDFRGDPSAALLEVLDPEQNSTFNDHYLDLDYDLSDVMFITTANYLHGIPIPLQDRMEIIQLPGYTEFEKVSIAERYLIPKQKRDNGIAEVPVDFPEETVRDVIHYYTKEAGVRNLEREIATVCRKIARDVVAKKAPVHMLDDGPSVGWRITPKRLTRYLGPHRFRYGRQEGQDEIGLVMGLAVTMHGGELLATEVSIVAGKGKLVLTGKLGDVMQESAQAAISYIRARAPSLGLDRDFYNRADIHVHLPEGAIPKDGPSAGITMCTGLVSALLRVPVRRDLAMTGEITLRGRVLAIGGLKEKILAAHRSGITTVIMPKENAKDLRDIPKRVLKTLKVIPVDHMDEVLRAALVLPDPANFLTSPSVPVDWRQPQERRDDRRDRERRDEPSRMPVASAVPPPSAIDDPPAGETPPGQTPENPGSSPDTNAHRALDLGLEEISNRDPGRVPCPRDLTRSALRERYGPRRISTPLTTSRAGVRGGLCATGGPWGPWRRPARPGRASPRSSCSQRTKIAADRSPHPWCARRTIPSRSIMKKLGNEWTPQPWRACPETSVPMVAPGGGGFAARNRRTSSGVSPASTSTIRTRPPSAWSMPASSGNAR